MKCTWILPNLAVGSDPRIEEEFQELKSLKITAILSLQTDQDRGDGGIEGEQAAARKAGLAFSSVPIEDFNRADLQTCLPDGVAALERMLDQGHTVYVHCTAGVSRSPTVVVAYLHWCLGFDVLQALIHVQACRVCLPDADVIYGARRRKAAGSQ
jgi:protein-tyrosine phosphatase